MAAADLQLYLRDDFSDKLPLADNTQGALLAWAHAVAERAEPADVYREKDGRKTLRITVGGSAFFLKLHTGVGWREILKNLWRGRKAVVSAADEYIAVEALRKAGVDTLSIAAFTVEGLSPARRQSLIVSDELSGTVSLEDYCSAWGDSPPPFALRMELIRKLAEIAAAMHAAGINHRDFYLCHFHLDMSSVREGPLRCYLIDLHRAQLRSHTPDRWRERDLAALYFSAMDCGLTRRDCLRFIKHYGTAGLRASLVGDRKLWQRVERRAHRLYQRGRRG